MSTTLVFVYLLIVNRVIPTLARTAFPLIINQTTSPITPNDCHSWTEVDCQDHWLHGHPDFLISCVEGAVGYFSCPVSCRLQPESDACLIYCEKYLKHCIKVEGVAAEVYETNKDDSKESGQDYNDSDEYPPYNDEHGPEKPDLVDSGSEKSDPQNYNSLGEEKAYVDNEDHVDPRIADQKHLNVFFKVAPGLIIVGFVVLYLGIVCFRNLIWRQIRFT